MSQLFVLLAASAIVIAAIGQLGIAVHVATRRRREVGLRKTLGSSTSGVIGLLLVDFGRPVVLANLAAWPAAYLAAGEYLQAFAYRIAVTPWPFVLSLGALLPGAWAPTRAAAANRAHGACRRLRWQAPALAGATPSQQQRDQTDAEQRQ